MQKPGLTRRAFAFFCTVHKSLVVLTVKGMPEKGVTTETRRARRFTEENEKLNRKERKGDAKTARKTRIALRPLRLYGDPCG